MQGAQGVLSLVAELRSHTLSSAAKEKKGGQLMESIIVVLERKCRIARSNVPRRARD